jgi:hypothetical protein
LFLDFCFPQNGVVLTYRIALFLFCFCFIFFSTLALSHGLFSYSLQTSDQKKDMASSSTFSLAEWKANFLDLLITWQAGEVDFEVNYLILANLFLTLFTGGIERGPGVEQTRDAG